jgi:hypothetical protein
MPRTRPRTSIAALLTLAAFLASAGSAAAVPSNDFLIVLGKRIGPYRLVDTSGGFPPSYPAAVEAFGSPSAKGTDAPGSNLCTVRWRKLGLDMGFASQPGACKPATLRRSAWFGATLTDRRWRTLRGLRVGDTAATLKSKYPNATFHDDPPRPPEYWLATYDFDGNDVPWLIAVIQGGTVTAIEHTSGYIY